MTHATDRHIRGGRTAIIVMLLGTLLGLGMPGIARADVANATVVPALPYTDTIDFGDAAPDTEATDCTYGQPTEWYAYTSPVDQELAARAGVTNYTLISVFTGSVGDLTAVVCGYYPPVKFDVAAGQTVYVAVVDGQGSGGTDTFTLDVAPPPVTVDVTVDERVTLGSAPGTATVSGTVTCSTDAYAEIYGSLRQRHGQTVVRGDFFANSACSATPRTWTATADAGSQVFSTRAATVVANFSAWDGFSYDSGSATQEVRIVRR